MSFKGLFNIVRFVFVFSTFYSFIHQAFDWLSLLSVLSFISMWLESIVRIVRIYWKMNVSEWNTVDTTRINPLCTYVCTEWIFDSHLLICNGIFLKIFVIEVGSSHPYASFGIFRSIFRGIVILSTFGKIRDRRHFSSETTIWPFPNNLQRLTAYQIIDQFRRKRCQKKR